MTTSPPDLLRRFVATPYHTVIRAKNSHCRVMSNDSDLIECLRELSLASNRSNRADWVCRILRDIDRPVGAEKEISFGHDGLHVECYQSGTQFVVDWESREIFGFIAPGDEVSDVVGRLVSLLHRAATLPLNSRV